MNAWLLGAVPLLLALVHGSFAYKILVVAPSPSISHQKPFHILTEALLERGHEITFLTTDPMKLSNKNLTEIDMSSAYKLAKAVNFVSWAYLSPVETLGMILNLGAAFSRAEFEDPTVQDFIRKNQTFDAMILERQHYHAYYGLHHRVGSPPLIGFVTLGAFTPVYYAIGDPVNPAYQPDVWVGLSDHMNFWQRLYSTYFQLRFYYTWFYDVIPQHEALMREFFGMEAPPIYETEFNYSLLITNSHFALEFPRPLLPNTVEITGIHVPTKVEPLPKDVQKFLDEAEHGVIYFSLGSNVRSKNLPPETLQAFLEAFRQLPQRVLWKWEDDSLPNKPDNVMISKWLPQPSILAHPKVRLFITQGGLQSMNEAVYHAVPFLVIPFFADQHHNAAKIVQAHVGVWLDIYDITKDTLLRSLRTVLEDPKYKENMRQLSAVFREHKEDSMERAVKSIEYVIRHRGAPHMRSAALDLRWWQLLLLDIIAFVLAVAALAVCVLYLVMRRIVSSFKGDKQKQKKH